MDPTLFSPSWYRVSGLKPRLRGHARIHRHEYRGEIWYVLQDPAKGSFYRFTPQAHHVIALMNGERTIQEIWENATERFEDDAPTQSEVIQLLSQLHAADLFISNVPPDTVELLRRAEKTRRARWWSNLRSPLALRFPLVDPERFLQKTMPAVRPLFSLWGTCAWLALVIAAAVTAGMHWPELTENVVDRVLSVDNLLILWVAYPIVKILHELGHGYALKNWGGECHEMGILLLVLVPVPYVDASAASEFREKHRRVLVGAAGIAVEVLLASVALLFWANMEPGILRSVAYNVALIGSVSTIVFNANPLLRYDGYYILSDLIDVPNLSQRGLRYVGDVFKRKALGIDEAVPLHAAPGERFWFVTYTLASIAYRAIIYTAIVFFIAGKFFKIGLLLAAWALFSMVAVPIFKGVKFLVSAPTVRQHRTRAWAVTVALVAVVALALFVMPFPSWTRAEGVIWVPEESLVRAGTDGFVTKVDSSPGARVSRGDLLVECRDPFLTANVDVLRAQLREAQRVYDAALARGRVETQVARERVRDLEASLARAEERAGDLNLRSPSAGILVLPDAGDLVDLYLHQGDLIGYVLDVERPTIRVVIPQSRIDLVRQRTLDVRVRLADQIDRVVRATLRREVPGAAERLPSTILGRAGGGEIAIDPTDRGGRKTFEKTFQFDIEVLDPLDAVFVGARAYVRFDHGTEPIASQVYRRLRQMVLRRLNV